MSIRLGTVAYVCNPRPPKVHRAWPKFLFIKRLDLMFDFVFLSFINLPLSLSENQFKNVHRLLSISTLRESRTSRQREPVCEGGVEGYVQGVGLGGSSQLSWGTDSVP